MTFNFYLPPDLILRRPDFRAVSKDADVARARRCDAGANPRILRDDAKTRLLRMKSVGVAKGSTPWTF